MTRKDVNLPVRYIEKYMYLSISILSYENENLIGQLSCPYLKNSVQFNDLTQLILIMDQIMQDCHIPKCDVRYRTFCMKRQKIVSPLEYKNQNDLINEESLKTSFMNLENTQNSFLVEIMYRQNYSWQGKMTWIQENKTKMFRSALELMHILYSTLDEMYE